MIKSGVKIAGIRPEMVYALMIADRIYQEYGLECVLTSCMEGKHRRGSLHYVGLAIDLRSRDMSDTVKIEVINKLQKKLGENFDVVKSKYCLHLEFNPK
ncbi:MAG: hypothetical protein GY861_14470 [bacterium]|nr:hypothetical protein [bacterium]